MNKYYFDKLVAEIGNQGLDALLIAPSEDLLFIMGFYPIFCERFQGLFVTKEGNYFYVCNLLTAEEASEHLPNKKVYSWFDGDGFIDAVRTALTENNLIGRKIGVSAAVRAYNILEIAESIDVKWVSARHLCHEIRIQKTDEEMEGLRGAGKIADKAFEMLIPQIKPGMTEGEVKAILLNNMISLGGLNPRALVASGPNGGFPHYNLASRIIQEGDAIVIDFSCEYKLVRTDMTRTIFIGEPTEEQKKVYNLVRAANEAAEKVAVEGAWIPDIDAAARNIIAKAGYGDKFTTRLGHGIGYLGHEAPDIKKNNERKLERRMAFTIEPGIYLAGDFGVRIEDVVLINDKGETEILNNFTKDMIVIK